MPLFVQAIEEGRPVTIYGDGEQSRDFTYVENVVAANLDAAAATGAAGAVLNIAAGGSETVNTLADTIGRLLGLPVERVHAPTAAGRRRAVVGGRLARPGADRFEPHVGFEEGLRLTIDSLADKED